MKIQDKKNETGDYFEFGRWAFLKMDTLIFQADGPDKAHPDRLFIEDRCRRFRIYFEEECRDEWHGCFQWKDYGRFEIEEQGKRVVLRYPLQKKRPNVTLGYFRIQFTDARWKEEFCDGTLSISSPVCYMDGVKQYKDLYKLFQTMKRI